MDVLIQKKYYSGRSEPGTWSSIYTYKPQNLEIKKERGEIFAVICLRGPKEFDLAVAGNMLLDKMHETYFENRSDSALVSMEKAVLATGHFLQKVLENDEHGDKGVDLDIMTLAVLGDVIYLMTLGQGKIFALRDGIISELSDSLRDPTGEGLIKEASLIAKKGDVYIIGTPQVRIEMTDDELEKAAADFNDLMIKNRSFADESAVSLMMIGFNIDRNAEKFIPKQALVPEVTAEPLAAESLETIVEDEVASKDAAAVTLEVAQEPENQVDQLDQVDQVDQVDQGLDEEVTLEDMIEQDKQNLPDNSGAVASEDEDFKSDDEFQEALIDETVAVETSPKTRLANTGASVLVGKLKGLFSKKPAIKSTEVEDVLSKETSPVALGNQKTYQVILKKIGLAILVVLDKIKTLVWDKWLGMGVDKNNIYLQTAAKKRKWGLLAILVLVVAGVVYLSFQNLAAQQQIKAAYEKDANTLTEAEAIIKTINDKIAIYAKLSADDTRKVEPLKELATAESKLEDAKSNPELANEIAMQEALIVSIRNTFNRIVPVDGSNYVVDLATKFPNIKIIDMDIFNNEIYLLPGAANVTSIYAVDYNGNNLREIKVSLTNPKSMTIDDKGNLIVLDSDTDKELVIIDPNSGTSSRVVATSSSAVGNATQIDFVVINGQGRIYLINPNDKAITYYTRSGSTYSTINKRNTIDELSTAKDLAVVDGKIYLIMQINAGLYRDYNKQSENLSITGLSTGDNLLGASSLFVDGTYIYVADPAKKRVVVLTKDVVQLPLVAQYTYSGTTENAWTEMTEVVADSGAQKIFLLDHARVYTLDMGKLLGFVN